MARPTTSDLNLFLGDLLSGDRKTQLLLAPCGVTYTALFTEKQHEFQKLPPLLLRERPLADELDVTDDLHDGYGAAVWFAMNSYLRLPEEAPEVHQEAELVLQVFIPSLSELKASYADEAARAKERLSTLTEHKELLQRFPVRANRTLYDLVEKFLLAGVRLDALLSERARRNAAKKEDADAEQKTASKLLNETVKLIRDCRSSMANDLKAQPKLPRNLDAQVFGYLDDLIARRAEALAKSRATKAAAQAADEAEATIPGDLSD
jgi:hypothetical protein